MQTELEANIQSYFLSLFLASLPIEHATPKLIRNLLKDIEEFTVGKLWISYKDGRFTFKTIEDGEI